MFNPSEKPRIFAMPPGADFGRALVNGLDDRFKDMSAADIARTEIYVNTTRMQRRIRTIFDDGPARLLPKIRLVTDLAMGGSTLDIPAPVSPLRRRLELTQFVAALLDREPDLAPRTALFDLADSLATLMDEMQGEGVPPSALAELDVSDQSGHWQRALRFLAILEPFFDALHDTPDKEARQRLIVERLVEKWAVQPPTHPIIVAGSTGSRGATGLFMQAVAKLPQGALILPGFDFDMSEDDWAGLASKTPAEDHPQYRFHALLNALALGFDDVQDWTAESVAPAPARNRLISLSLRPAPVTNKWMVEGPGLGNLLDATEGMTLVETSSPRAEAETIALRLRQAAQDGIFAALITPDRMLTRRVAAALDRWDIIPDDSAGTPLAQSAPGRFLRHVGQLLGTTPSAEELLIILKHPICHTGGTDRGPHLLRTRELELRLRRYGPPVLNSAALLDWAEHSAADDPGRIAWATWICDIIEGTAEAKAGVLTTLLETHINAAEQFSQGPNGADIGELWREAAGREARKTCDVLINDSDAGGTMNVFDYTNLFSAVLSKGVVRDRDAGHPNILIWGTLEARVQGADLVILGGLNDGVWPESPAPDPWLNRAMRQQVGLLLPERRIGLSAHDYQQAIGAKEVWITRSKRSAESETIPSRWLNRLVNLLDGLPKQQGKEALNRMRSLGQTWIDAANALQEPATITAKATRPSPQPPVFARPKELSVTRIKTLIRDPFAIYAEKVLRIRPLDPLKTQADPPLRGEIFHKILELFISEKPDASDPAALDRFHEIALAELEKNCPWPTVRLQWQTRLERIAPKFLADEVVRQATGQLELIEATGKLDITKPQFSIVGKADRIDRDQDGRIVIYDYKTGVVPTKSQQVSFDKQLLIEAAMVEKGAFEALGHAPVGAAAFIGVNADMAVVPAPLSEHPVEDVWRKFLTLLEKWEDPSRGYTARLAHFSNTDQSPYDHLSRFGEWTMADHVEPVTLR